jgi:hypothetical protein
MNFRNKLLFIHHLSKLKLTRNTYCFPFSLHPTLLPAIPVRISNNLYNNLNDILNDQEHEMKLDCHEFVKRMKCSEPSHIFYKNGEIIHSAIFIEPFYISKYGKLSIGVATKKMLEDAYL